MSIALESMNAPRDIIIAVVLIYTAWGLWSFYTSPLKSIPGPTLARWTNWYRLWRTYLGKAEQEQRQLHKKYGSAVRWGPNNISICDPAAIRVIYGFKNLWRKSDFYKVNDLFINKKRVENVFSTRDEAWNGRIMKPVIRVFAMSNILTLEARVDSTIEYMIQRLDEEFAIPKKVCPIDRWMHYFAWDVIGEVTFSTRMGFLEKGKDVQGQMKTIEGAMSYFSVIGQIPFLDYFLDKNPFYHIGPEVFGPSIIFTQERLAMRRQGIDKDPEAKQIDMLDMYLDAQKQYPDIVDEQTLLAYLMANTAAGSDTVATALRTVLYHLCICPEAMTRLKQELEDAKNSPQGLKLPITWSDCQTRLPYLDACVREGLRMCPGIALCLERVVPPQGFALSDGRFFPGGTVVGINPYVMNRHEGVFGADSDDFRPERWLKASNETEEAFKERLTTMRESEFTFGYGKRQCSGRNLAWVEVYKLIGTLLLTYDIELADPKKEWKTVNRWFVSQSEMDMVFHKRA